MEHAYYEFDLDYVNSVPIDNVHLSALVLASVNESFCLTKEQFVQLSGNNTLKVTKLPLLACVTLNVSRV